MQRRRKRSPTRAVLLAALIATAASAQAPQASADFHTRDGSRFLLLPTGGPPIVHWVIATPAGVREDPPGADDLAAACAQASLAGTWRLGSKDPKAEQLALADLTAHLQKAAATKAPGPDATPEAEAAYRQFEQQCDRARAAAAQLADPQLFLRVLAAAPAQDVTVDSVGYASLFACTTTVDGIAAVAALVVERREHAALRGLVPALAALRANDTSMFDADPMAPLYAEVLALAFPGHPLARSGQRPDAAIPERDTALAVWRRTQRPERSIHVLTGGFRIDAVRAVLERAFSHTELDREPIPETTVPPPLAGARHSVLPGAGLSACVIGWRLNGSEDPAVVSTLARWLGFGSSSWLARRLQQAGHERVEVMCSGPWPAGPGPAMFLVEAKDPDRSVKDLANVLLQLCQEAGKQHPAQGDLDVVYRERLQKLEFATRSPRDLARHVALAVFCNPLLRVPPEPLSPVAAEEVAALAENLFGTEPVVVERKAP
jgi:Peptidase M16 inactive domain